MAKYSVKKPFTVLVGVILVLVLGVVSLMGMNTDLLPSITLPYLVVVTTYPGASPEKVEEELTRPLESSLGTVNGVENVTSTSGENYSMVMLEFADDTDMDSAMVKTSTALNQLTDTLPDTSGTPMLLEITPDMMATEYIAVDKEGLDIYDLSAYVEESVIPNLERVSGVASVSSTGLVEQMVEVRLDQDKIDEVNDRLLVQVSDRLAEAKQQLDDARRQLNDSEEALITGQAELDDKKNALQEGKQQLADQQEATSSELAKASQQLDEAVAKVTALTTQLETLQGLQKTLQDELNGYLDGSEAEYQKISDLLAKMGTDIDTILSSEEAFQAFLDQVNAYLAQLQGGIPTSAPTAAPTAAPAPDGETTAPTPDTGLPLPSAPAVSLTEEELRYLLTLTKEGLTDLQKIHARVGELRDQLASLPDQLNQLQAAKDAAESNMQMLRDAYTRLEQGKITAAAGFGSGDAQLVYGQAALESVQSQLDSGKEQIDSGREQLDEAYAEYEDAREEALSKANLDQLLNISTLSQLIAAQNFSMPAGYIQDGEEQYLLKVGDTFESIDDLKGALLCNMEGIGDVRLSDVAEITLIDNSGESYARVNGNQAVLLSVFKSSTASTSAVSDACNAALDEMTAADPDLHLTPIMDQGDYIRLILNSVMTNLIGGAILAILVLAVFLKDLRPTLVVAVSIPLSVLFAIVLMYFTGISLNMISLSGLALGIGMLVDNSIVVIENIYRLRNAGVPAPRAAVQGARQMAGAIISSTLTTVCVFLPLLFAQGLTRELLGDMALTIAYSLFASLIVALTVVPAAGSTLLSRVHPQKHPFFDRVLAGYDKLLRFCLRVKVVPLTLAVALLAASVWQVTRMGLVMIPEISSDQMSLTMSVPEDTEPEDAFATADQVMERVSAIDGVETVGAMSSASMTSAFAGLSDMGGQDLTNFTYYILLTQEGSRDQSRIRDEITANTADLPCEVEVTSSSAADLSALSGSGVQVNIYGDDLDDLLTASQQVMDTLGTIDGIGELSNGQEAGEREIRVVVDKDKAMRLGLTVAQIYAELAQALTSETVSTSLTVGEDTYSVEIVDTESVPDLDDIFNYEFETTTMDAEGNSTTETHKLGEFATRSEAAGMASIQRENQSRYITVTSVTREGYNTSLLSREAAEKLQGIQLPAGCTWQLAGESTQVDEMISQMSQMLLLALILIYLVMVAQFQSLLSPFIVLFTVPLAFTGGMIGLILSGEDLSIMSLMGFLVLMGVVVNNGIVFVDYTNQLRQGGLERREALVASGKTRMRPILMTTLTTVLAMVTMLFSTDPGSELGRGMAIVIIGGLTYATLMTLFIVPVIYDLLFRRPPHEVDVGDDGMDDLPDDAAQYLAAMHASADEQEADPDGTDPDDGETFLAGDSAPAPASGWPAGEEEGPEETPAAEEPDPTAGQEAWPAEYDQEAFPAQDSFPAGENGEGGAPTC